MKRKTAKKHCNNDRQKGHIELGFTIAVMVIVGLLIYTSAETGKEFPVELFDLWLSQPWWIQLLTITVPVILIVLGAAFERSRKWPKDL